MLHILIPIFVGIGIATMFLHIVEILIFLFSKIKKRMNSRLNFFASIHIRLIQFVEMEKLKWRVANVVRKSLYDLALNLLQSFE